MEELIERITPESKRAFILGFGAAVAVLAMTIIAGLLYVRSSVRAQIAGRDAEGLYATTVMEQLDAATAYSGALEDDQLALEAALLASRLKGVIGIRFFDKNGRFKDSFPANIQPRNLQPWARGSLTAHRPSALLSRDVPLDQVFIYLPQFSTGQIARANILQVAVPLHSARTTNSFGAAEFVVEGESISSEYSRLDGHLALIGSLALIVGGLLLGGMLWPVFHRTQKLNSELEAQNQLLHKANQELALAARTSALGAVSAHLMHGLKNPLASLSEYLSTRIDQPGRNDPGAKSKDDPLREGSEALKTARRIQAMVNETLEVLADARGEPGYHINPRELVEAVCQKSERRATEKGVKLVCKVDASADLPSRVANLARLILSNLVDNAIQATPSGSTVCISAQQEGAALQRFHVKDHGPGFPEHLRQKLFLPCTSTGGGSGLGLAISKRLAEHLGAKLSLRSSSDDGCVFELELPVDGFSDLGASARSDLPTTGRPHPNLIGSGIRHPP